MNSETLYKDGQYFENNQSWHVEDSPWKANQVLKILSRNNLIPDTICEVGCGAGEILFQLSNKLTKTEFFGYEISPQAFELAASRKSDRVNFYLKDFLLENAFYDVVMAIDVIEHIEDYFTFLRALQKKVPTKFFIFL
jgi:2-polyprenyl-3-methyl-5-hydroxy-6-metoxy-1,4-benzoquinol methylase